VITRKRVLKAARRAISRLRLSVLESVGTKPGRVCPACHQKVVGFFSYGGPDWGCPACGASPRERFVNVCIDLGLLRLPRSGTILHMAPSEKSLVARFTHENRVVFGDLTPERYLGVRVQRVDLMDLSGLGTFDIVYASHVMEHVFDDMAVFRNIYEHIGKGGEAWFLVPLHDNPTIDGSPTLSARQRERLFGQWDHVRQYGVDLSHRLRSVGFEVAVLGVTDVPDDQVVLYGLAKKDKVFVARRT
jgi:SAM-dependent methyltransferase